MYTTAEGGTLKLIITQAEPLLEYGIAQILHEESEGWVTVYPVLNWWGELSEEGAVIVRGTALCLRGQTRLRARVRADRLAAFGEAQERDPNPILFLGDGSSKTQVFLDHWRRTVETLSR